MTLRLGQLGREPALAIMGVVGPVAGVALSWASGLSPTWQTALEALAYALAGLATALLVAGEKLVPAIVGLAQALLAIALAAGAPLTDNQQTVLMTAVALVAAAFVRTQVVAPIPAPFVPPPPTALPTPSPEPFTVTSEVVIPGEVPVRLDPEAGP